MNVQAKRIAWHAVLIGIATLLIVPPIGFAATPFDNKGGFNGFAAGFGWCLIGFLAAVGSCASTFAAFKAPAMVRHLSGFETLLAIAFAVLVCVAAIGVGLLLVVRCCPPWAGGG